MSDMIFRARKGSLDMRGFQIARVQFFNFANPRSVTFSGRRIKFSAECVRRLGGAEYAQLLIHPRKKLLAVRACGRENKRAVRWATKRDGLVYSRDISGAAYLGVLGELFDWLPDHKYRFRGTVKTAKEGSYIEFDLTEPEIIMPGHIRYCDDWSDGFGPDYYIAVQAQQISPGNAVHTAETYNSAPNIKPTSRETLAENIQKLMREMINTGE
jgi:hypothetical protein